LQQKKKKKKKKNKWVRPACSLKIVGREIKASNSQKKRKGKSKRVHKELLGNNTCRAGLIRKKKSPRELCRRGLVSNTKGKGGPL